MVKIEGESITFNSGSSLHRENQITFRSLSVVLIRKAIAFNFYGCESEPLNFPVSNEVLHLSEQK